ncbi:MAG TPA: sialidase family protein [Blastocatellia bacterium]|nr:sialidase family protein [Blastocatellia bacterium]
MKRRIVVVLVITAAVMLAVAGPFPTTRRATAQVGVQFGAQRFPAIDVDRNDVLYLMMSVATAPASEHRPHSQIFFVQSNDGGTTWNNLPHTRNLSNSPGEAFGPSLAVTKIGKARVYVTYGDNSNGVTQAYIIRSKKKSKFRKPLNMTPHDGAAFSPRVALDSGEGLDIVWSDSSSPSGNVAFLRSTDLGATFTDPIDVSRSSGFATEPEVAVDPSDAINVVWEDTAPGASQIMFSRSTDAGATFSDPVQVSTGVGPATEATVATDSEGRISVAWVDESGGNANAYYARSTDHGVTFSEPINVSGFANGDIHKPVLATFENTVYVAFQNGDLFGEENIKNRQVFLVKSSDAGVTFGDSEKVSDANNNVGRAHSPAMVVDSRGVLHLVWIDASVIGNDEGLLFYRRTSNGHSFSEERMILAII